MMTKNSEGLRKVSIHASSREAGSFINLVKHILHGQEMIIAPGLSIFTLPDGTVVEFYGIGSHYPDYLFSYSNIVNSYQVPDLQFALREMQKHGARLLGEVVSLSASCYYCHIRLEDGNVIGLLQFDTSVL
jgi:hypothetical protein